MVIYEIFSNAASTDQGLRDYPACMDLADTFRAMGVQTRFIKQIHQETDEINLAGQFGQGVRVRGMAMKALRPETHLKGCVAWSRAVLGRVERGLHLELSQVRATNGLPLVLGMVFRRGHHAFVSGLDPIQYSRLKAAPDLACVKIPDALVGQVGALEDYLARRQRPSGFFTQAAEVGSLECLDEALRKALTGMARARDTDALAKLTDAQVVNVGLISEFIERYQSIFEQFAAMLHQAEVGSELAAHFDVLTLGVPYPELKPALEPFTQEHTRGRIVDKRSLVNEVRIGMHNASDGTRTELVRKLRSVTLKHRMAQDPLLYGRCVLMPDARVEDVEVMSPVRDMWAGMKSAVDQVREAMRDKPPTAETPAPPPLKQALFEMLLRITFDAQYASKMDDARLPPSALAARRLLEGIRMTVYDLANLRKINSRLPVRGVASNLTEKIPVTWKELDLLLAQFARRMFPLGAMAHDLARTVRGRQRAEAEQRKADAVRQYLLHGNVLLGLTNFVMGRGMLAPEEWSGLLAAGRALGLPMLSSRDQIRNPTALRQIQAGLNERLEGYVLLMSREQPLFPLEAEPAALRAAYAEILEAQAVRLVRRFFFQKMQVLSKEYGKEMFEVLYRHVVRSGGLRMSRNQLGAVLVRHRVFDAGRLRELGFAGAAAENGNEGENEFLVAPSTTGEEGADAPQPFAGPRIAKEHQAALKEFRSLLQGYLKAPSGAKEGGHRLESALAALAKEEIFDPRLPAARTLLGQTGAAAQMWKVAQQAISQNFKTVLAGAGSAQEAIDILLPGRLAVLAYLKPVHTFKAGEHTLLFRLVPEPDASAEMLPAGSAAVAQALAAAAPEGPSPTPLSRAIALLDEHIAAWDGLRDGSMVPLIDQILRETLLKAVQPTPPSPQEVRAFADEQVLCLGVSSSDQGKFQRIVNRPDKPDVFATLSELASWLARFPRLDDEMENYREMIADIVKVIGAMNFTVWDAPYLDKLRDELEKMRETLSLRPEHMGAQDLVRIEEQAREIGRMVRDIHTQEQALRPRDRWLNRIATRLRAISPNASLTFVDRLHEGSERDLAGPPKAEAQPVSESAPGKEPQKAKEDKEYQTFSERVRNVIQYREKLENKRVFVLSPANTQRALTMSLIDRLFALKGLSTPILVDISGCESFVTALRTRLPPHRMFNMNEM